MSDAHECCAGCERPIDDAVGKLVVLERAPNLYERSAFCSHLCLIPWLADVVHELERAHREREHA